MVQDPSGFVAMGSELSKEVPGSQQNIRFPGGSTYMLMLGFCVFQLELHHAPWLNAAALRKKLVKLSTLDTSHFEMSELKALAE